MAIIPQIPQQLVNVLERFPTAMNPVSQNHRELLNGINSSYAQRETLDAADTHRMNTNTSTSDLCNGILNYNRDLVYRDTAVASAQGHPAQMSHGSYSIAQGDRGKVYANLGNNRPAHNSNWHPLLSLGSNSTGANMTIDLQQQQKHIEALRLQQLQIHHKKMESELSLRYNNHNDNRERYLPHDHAQRYPSTVVPHKQADQRYPSSPIQQKFYASQQKNQNSQDIHKYSPSEPKIDEHQQVQRQRYSSSSSSSSQHELLQPQKPSSPKSSDGQYAPEKHGLAHENSIPLQQQPVQDTPLTQSNKSLPTIPSLQDKRPPESDSLNSRTVGGPLSLEKSHKDDDGGEWGSVTPAAAAFLGPQLWEKTLGYNSDLKVQLEYMDLDDFLTENNIPHQQQQLQQQKKNTQLKSGGQSKESADPRGLSPVGLASPQMSDDSDSPSSSSDIPNRDYAGGKVESDHELDVVKLDSDKPSASTVSQQQQQQQKHLVNPEKLNLSCTNLNPPVSGGHFPNDQRPDDKMIMYPRITNIDTMPSRHPPSPSAFENLVNQSDGPTHPTFLRHTQPQNNTHSHPHVHYKTNSMYESHADHQVPSSPKTHKPNLAKPSMVQHHPVMSPKYSPPNSMFHELSPYSSASVQHSPRPVYRRLSSTSYENTLEDVKPPIDLHYNVSETDLALATVPGQDFDPRRRCFTAEELKPQPMIKKSRKQLIPTDMKDDKYWCRRQKNNVAAKRSRDARRLKENQIAMRTTFLENENNQLAMELEQANGLIESLKKRLASYESA